MIANSHYGKKSYLEAKYGDSSDVHDDWELDEDFTSIDDEVHIRVNQLDGDTGPDPIEVAWYDFHKHD
ncbi:hypothetical protein [Rheinheimera oceanensis]|uniref:hypothetical protein n=1 Tax=Rheinheimera oceanensis TaxID=2817449 RepID=UPI001BFEAB14|nr:hypothetical protein [Rheinheimera oceanensis]